MVNNGKKNTLHANSCQALYQVITNEQINKLSSEYNISPHIKETSEITLLFSSTSRSYGFVESYPLKISKINFGHTSDLKQRINGSIYYDENGRRRYAGKSQIDIENNEVALVSMEEINAVANCRFCSVLIGNASRYAASVRIC